MLKLRTWVEISFFPHVAISVSINLIRFITAVPVDQSDVHPDTSNGAAFAAAVDDLVQDVRGVSLHPRLQ